jgi:putative glutamine amidotransferase
VRPLIGITCATHATGGGRPLFGLYQSYARAVAAAGGAPVLIPSLGSCETESLRSLFESLDGLLLPGGADIQPGAYGAEPHPRLGGVDPTLDETELQLARWALSEDLAVLGICRGQQTLNVAAGGTLYQDIPSELPQSLTHRVEPRDAIAHDIEVESDSRLADLLGATQVPVNSLHHQAVREVARGFEVVARAPDGIIEGLERPGHPFAVSVQFHPEELVPGHAASERLFECFIRETLSRMLRRTHIVA